MKLTGKQALLLRAFSGWTIYVWATRIWNIWRNAANDVPFKVVHSALALVSVALAIAALVVVQKNRRTAAAGTSAEGDRVNA